MRSAVLVVVILVGAGCKKPPDADIGAALTQMGSFADAMCRCASASCAGDVHRDMLRWTEDMAKKPRGRDAQPTDDQQQRMAEYARRYQECMAKLAPAPVDAGVDAAVIVDAAPVGPEPVKPPATAGALVIAASAWAKAERVRSASFSYVGADGVLDPEFGTFDVRFGLGPVNVDDPNRRTGAPVPAAKDRPTECEHAAWSAKDGWTTKMMSCGEVDVAGPRCPVTEVWKRAIKRGAPADALAVLHYQTGNGNGAWMFRISDPPRGVNVQLGFTDDCDLAVESPTPGQTPF